MRKAAAVLFSGMVAIVSAVHAQDQNSPETQATIKPGESAHMDRDSIGDYGPMKRFDVDLVWSDASGARPADHKNRKVRYVADCKAGTLTVAAVAVFDRTGMTEKRMMVPPGAADPVKPDAGSPAAKWLQNVCHE
jgi:hypothetical protein